MYAKISTFTLFIMAALHARVCGHKTEERLPCQPTGQPQIGIHTNPIYSKLLTARIIVAHSSVSAIYKVLEQWRI